jgi:carbonic anhydrase/acetyltransferase-like protein (isoleucine patch superfamily)
MIREFKGIAPVIHDGCFIAETAVIIGSVILKENVNIWYNAVLRGDVSSIEIGRNTNVQDNVTIHVNSGMKTVIGDNVTIGHGAIVHACTLGSNVLVGMGAIVLDGAVVGDNVIIGAGALVPPNKRIPAGSMVIGSPCVVKRDLTAEEIQALEISAIKYVENAKSYK